MRPRQANLRRAVSSAYYALFHYLTDQACRMMMGAQLNDAPFRHAIARGFDHGTMKEACRSFSAANLPPAISRRLPAPLVVPPDLRNVARAFVELQEQRHAADYDLSQRFTRADVLALVRQAEHALTHFDAVGSRTLKRFFLCSLWAWKGMSRR